MCLCPQHKQMQLDPRIRIGLLLYGIGPNEALAAMEPALSADGLKLHARCDAILPQPVPRSRRLACSPEEAGASVRGMLASYTSARI